MPNDRIVLASGEFKSPEGDFHEWSRYDEDGAKMLDFGCEVHSVAHWLGNVEKIVAGHYGSDNSEHKAHVDEIRRILRIGAKPLMLSDIPKGMIDDILDAAEKLKKLRDNPPQPKKRAPRKRAPRKATVGPSRSGTKRRPSAQARRRRSR